jgi:hypothetical protein
LPNVDQVLAGLSGIGVEFVSTAEVFVVYGPFLKAKNSKND